MTDLIRQAAEDIERRRDDADAIERIINDAVAREREACAKAAERYYPAAGVAIRLRVRADVRARQATSRP